jgi:NADH-quinone oxidoreductase subunit M
MNLPILTIITFLPLIGVFFILFNKGEEERVSKISFHVSLLTSLLVFVLSLFLWFNFDKTISSFQFVEEKKWIIDFVKYKLGVDGISILFVVLTAFITPICIVATYNSVKFRKKDFFIALLVMETMMIGVFCSLDLFLFYLCFR